MKKFITALIVMIFLSFGIAYANEEFELNDVVYILQVSSGMETSQSNIDDINNDERIGLEEAIYIMQVLSGIRVIVNEPANIQTMLNDAQVVISWDLVDGATGYNIYMATESGVDKDNYEKLTEGDKFTGVNSPYTMDDLTGGVTYYFVVTASAYSGESDVSVEVSAIVPQEGKE